MRTGFAALGMLVGLLALTAGGTVFAIDTGERFDDPEMQARYERIIAEVRCVKCQNQSIKDSNALIASDLRREIRRMLTEGKTDREIFEFLVARYGEFVLYRPRSLIFWLAPGLLLLGGAFFLVQVVRKRMTLPIDIDADEGAA